MYQTIYRKYRPKNFDEVMGQSHIVSTLKTQIISSKTSHAYIFCGTRGTGKTSCAKILSKAINCENLQNGNPCNECHSCNVINNGTSVDVVEIDAASNNGVDNIRSLIEEVQYMPVELKKRVYIIDEVHMLSQSAFNALLKTLEEPPDHVVFILATTEIHKIPATIMSRCQRFDFKRINVQIITDTLMKTAGLEGISMEREAAKIIAKLSDGAMRNAYSMLESCTGFGGMVTSEVLINRLGISNREQLIEIISSAAYKNSARAIKLIFDMYESQNDFSNVLNELLKLYRDMLIIKTTSSPEMFLECYDNELPRLKEICEKVTYETLCYQSTVIQSLFENADRFGENLKAAFEIAMIKLCNPPKLTENIQLSAETVPVSGNTQLSAETVPVSENVSKRETHKKTVSMTETECAEEKKIVSTQPMPKITKYEKYDKLREIVAQKVPVASPFFEKATVEYEKDTLYVRCPDMLAKMILSNNVNLPLLKSAVCEVSPEIKNVVVTDKAAQIQKDDEIF